MAYIERDIVFYSFSSGNQEVFSVIPFHIVSPNLASYVLCNCITGVLIPLSTSNTKSFLSKCLLFFLVTFPCGKMSSLSQWDRRQSANIQSDYEGLTCGPEECPWQVNGLLLILQTSCFFFIYTLELLCSVSLCPPQLLVINKSNISAKHF